MFARKKLEIFLCYYFFVILHELVHILVATFLNVKVTKITLLPVGVNATYTGHPSKIKEIIFTLAGPLASFLFYVFLKNELLKNINLIICLFNMIPIFPFDGGRIIKNIFALKFGTTKGNKYATIVSHVFLMILTIIVLLFVIFFKNYYMLIFLIYIFNISKEELTSLIEWPMT